MSNQAQNTDLQQEELFVKLITSEDITRKILEGFLKAGIPLDELEDIVDLRNALTAYDSDGNTIARVNSNAIIVAYKVCEGDLDDLSEVVNEAEATLNNHGRQLCAEDFNQALRQALRTYKNGWERDMEVCDDEWWLEVALKLKIPLI